MKIQHIRSASINALQSFVEPEPLRLAVGPISTECGEDWDFLSNDYGCLTWSSALTTYGNQENAIGVVFKSIGSKNIAGAILGIYNEEDCAYEIHMIESFIKQHHAHPLKGRLFMLSIVFSTIFLAGVEGKLARLIAPFPETVEYYKQFGFVEKQDDKYIVLEASKDVLFEQFHKLTQKLI